MAEEKLDLSPLERSIDRLNEGLERYLQDTNDLQIRDGNEQGLLLEAWPEWKNYRDMRSKTSYTYDEDIALRVVANIPKFLSEARYLCDQIKARLV